MKEIYEAAEMELVAFLDEDTISTSSYNDGEAGAGWDIDTTAKHTVDPSVWEEYGSMWA